MAYALLGHFTLRIKTYLAFLIFSILIFLAYSGIAAFNEVRIPGVLQRIGIVYFFASLLYLTSNLKTQIIVAASILLVYWCLMTLIPVPGFGEANFDPAKTSSDIILKKIAEVGHDNEKYTTLEYCFPHQ